MRLWTLHPKYLDGRGLVALWREALLAQAVLRGETKGFRHHPQLLRFRQHPSPGAQIASYLRGVREEACRRGYCFDAGKIAASEEGEVMLETQGQLLYEWLHLKEKLRLRAPSWLEEVGAVAIPEPHPLFVIIPGEVAKWESGGL